MNSGQEAPQRHPVSFVDDPVAGVGNTVPICVYRKLIHDPDVAGHAAGAVRIGLLLGLVDALRLVAEPFVESYRPIC